MKIFNKIKEYLGFKKNDESIPANNFIPESLFDRFIPTSNHLLNSNLLNSNFITSVDPVTGIITISGISGASNINDYNIMQDNSRIMPTYSNYKKERILSKLKKVYKIADSEVIDFAKFKIKGKYLIFKIDNKYKIRLKNDIKPFDLDEYFKTAELQTNRTLQLTGTTY